MVGGRTPGFRASQAFLSRTDPAAKSQPYGFPVLCRPRAFPGSLPANPQARPLCREDRGQVSEETQVDSQASEGCLRTPSHIWQGWWLLVIPLHSPVASWVAQDFPHRPGWAFGLTLPLGRWPVDRLDFCWFGGRTEMGYLGAQGFGPAAVLVGLGSALTSQVLQPRGLAQKGAPQERREVW